MSSLEHSRRTVGHKALRAPGMRGRPVSCGSEGCAVPRRLSDSPSWPWHRVGWGAGCPRSPGGPAGHSPSLCPLHPGRGLQRSCALQEAWQLMQQHRPHRTRTTGRKSRKESGEGARQRRGLVLSEAGLSQPQSIRNDTGGSPHSPDRPSPRPSLGAPIPPQQAAPRRPPSPASCSWVLRFFSFKLSPFLQGPQTTQREDPALLPLWGPDRCRRGGGHAS